MSNMSTHQNKINDIIKFCKNVNEQKISSKNVKTHIICDIKKQLFHINPGFVSLLCFKPTKNLGITIAQCFKQPLYMIHHVYSYKDPARMVYCLFPN